MKPARQPILAILFVSLCAFLNAAGWALSALHQLNRTGYAVALLLFAGGWWWWRRSAITPGCSLATGARWRRRFRHPLPGLFLLIAALVFLGGVLYAPANYDALTYRLPRLLNWLVAEHWFWIPTNNDRLNYSGTAWEWTAMPLLVLTRSDRALFLINALSFLLLPGLLFAIFRQLGVARRVAWTWMWLVPLAYGFVTQAGSIGNDLTGTTFFLLAIFFGLRARKSGRVGEVWLALLAAALMTGVKFSNLPLALPCLVAVWPALRQLPKQFVTSVAVVGLAVVVSAAPIILANQQHTGNWTGDPNNAYRIQVKNPAAALLGNSLLLAQQSFMPPVLLAPGRVNDWIDRHLPAAWTDLLQRQFPRYSLGRLSELPMEEGAGLGLGITAALLAALAATAAGLGGLGTCGKFWFRKLWPATALAVWAAVGVYLLKMGSEAAPRLLLPYYPLALVPFLLLPAQSLLLRRRAWRVFLVLVALSVLPAMILSATRPLWPAATLSAKMQAAFPKSATWQRAAAVYSVYGHRNDVLAPVRACLPPTADKISLVMACNDTAYSLWRPFGRRQVLELSPVGGQFPALPPDREWLVVKEHAWTEVSAVPLAEWAQAHHATRVASFDVVELVSAGPETWTVLHCEPR